MNNTGALTSTEWLPESQSVIVRFTQNEQNAATSRFATSVLGRLPSDLQVRVVFLVRSFMDMAHLLASCTYTYGILRGRLREARVPYVVALEILQSHRGDVDKSMRSVPDIAAFGEVFSVLLENIRPYSNLQDAGLARAVKQCPDLEQLDLSCTFDLTDESIVAIVAHCQHLKKLRLMGCYHVSDQGVAKLMQGCKELISLDLSFTCITDVALDAIEQHGIWLEKLDLRGCPNLTMVRVLHLREHSQATVQYWPCTFPVVTSPLLFEGRDVS